LNGTGLEGTCASQSSENGNISTDPKFVSTKNNGNYHLKAGSPVIDSGDNSAPNLPLKDLAGKPRIVDGNNDGTATIDIGAYEFQ
jgi:hypothetical protein